MLDKRLCRKFADPGLTIPPCHGLLYAEQVKYIVRTAVKIIGCHRILVLYVYDREQAARGNCRPRWTMFQQGTEDYITLARSSDGPSKWRTACFDHLNGDYDFMGKCAFYSQQDDARVSRYLGGAGGGFSSLYIMQSKIQALRLEKRQFQRNRKILERMKPVHALPRGLKSWVRRSVMPAYFFYDYSRAKTITGVCTSCGKEAALPGVRHNGKAVCPHCKRELIMKSRGRRGQIHNQDTCQVVQKIGPDELIVRIIKVHYDYLQDAPEEIYLENARIFIRLDEAGKVRCDSYYYGYGHYELTPWKHGSRPVFYPYQYNYEADTCGHVYCANLPAALDGTPWKYCPVQLFYEHYREPMELAPFLTAHVEHPRFEHLLKVGFFGLAADLAYREHGSGTLDETQGRTHRILQVAPEDVAFLRDLDVGLPTLRAFQKHSQENLNGRQKLFLWTREHKVARDIDNILGHVTVHKLIRYMDKQYSFLQFRKTQYGGIRYRDMQALVSEYRDYLDMCVKENYDMRNSFVLYPADLQKSHDKTAQRVKRKANAQMRRDFEAVYRRIANRLDFQRDGMKIVYPATPDDIIAEGHALHHCVGSYVDRVARKECMILFLRHCEDISTPFYTIEIQGQKVVQVRGMNNGDATAEVQAFIACWTREVLQISPVAA